MTRGRWDANLGVSDRPRLAWPDGLGETVLPHGAHRTQRVHEFSRVSLI
jgi:hypothetical protein